MPSADVDTTPEPAEAPSPRTTLLGLLAGQHRAGTPIRSLFLQERGGDRAPGPLHLFVTERRLFALHLYLLLHCLALADPWDVWLPSGAWARALGNTSKTAEATVSRNWRWLKAKNLVDTERDGRILRAYLTLEDGTGSDYTRPKGQYFILPLAFFRNEWHTKLSLAATAALLVALDRTRSEQWFQLRKEPASAWFGISADTLQKGLDELRDEHQLIENRPRTVQDVRARYGVTTVTEYRLLGDFTRGARSPSTAELDEE